MSLASVMSSSGTLPLWGKPHGRMRPRDHRCRRRMHDPTPALTALPAPAAVTVRYDGSVQRSSTCQRTDSVLSSSVVAAGVRGAGTGTSWMACSLMLCLTWPVR